LLFREASIGKESIMFPAVDLLDVEVLEVLPESIRVSVPTRSGPRRELLIPRQWICDDVSVKKGTVGPLSVFYEWARKEGLL
jgi:hypothetical protein